MKPEDNPFFAGWAYWGAEGGRSGRHPMFYMGASDRLMRVKMFGRAECARALELSDLQKAVRVAIERRQRALKRPAK